MQLRSISDAKAGRRCRYYLNVGPGHAAARELGVLLCGARAEIHFGFHLALAGVQSNLIISQYNNLIN